MSLWLQGLVLGIVLSFAIGPILFTLLQTSLDRGVAGGLAVASGIWVSDVAFISVMFASIAYIQNFIKLPNFEFVAGMLGAVVLVAVGIGMILDRRIPNRAADQEETVARVRKRDYVGLWIKGFLINSLNPFTVFFWAAISTNTLGHEAFTFEHVGGFFIGLMAAVIVFDVAKIIGANRVRSLLTDTFIIKVRRISGSVLIVFGLVLIVRVTFL